MDLFKKKKKIVVGGKNPRGKLSSLCMKAVTSVGETETRGRSQDAPERLPEPAPRLRRRTRLRRTRCEADALRSPNVSRLM